MRHSTAHPSPKHCTNYFAAGDRRLTPVQQMRVSYIALLWLFSVTPIAAFVMGEDDRRPASTDESLISGVAQTGMIKIPGEEFVTGLLVGANCDIVISAGHAAFHWRTVEHRNWHKGQRRGNGKLTFSLNPTATTWTPMILVASGYDNPANIVKEHHDWAVFKLTERAATDCAEIYYENYKVACRGAIIMPGFHFDRRDVRLVDASCSIRYARDNRLIIHDCDTKDGSSGAPLLCRENEKTYLVGINVSGLTERSYIDPGVYGQSGKKFRHRRHENFAVAVHGFLHKTLSEEFTASSRRSLACN